jgi:chromate reductase
MKIVAFAASNSRESINRRLAAHAASLSPAAEVEVLDLNDYEMPLFGVDREAELGQPAAARAFLDKIAAADALVISFAEHNGGYTAAYKSLFDWCSRIEKKVYQGKPAVLLATSPGPRGARNVLETAVAGLPRFGAEVRASLSVPNFADAFDSERGELIDADLRARLQSAVDTLND